MAFLGDPPVYCEIVDANDTWEEECRTRLLGLRLALLGHDCDETSKIDVLFLTLSVTFRGLDRKSARIGDLLPRRSDASGVTKS